MADSEVTKRRVTMRNEVFVGRDADNNPLFQLHEAIDYVRPDFLDAYVENARRNWSSVEVSEEPDAGPLGFDGPTWVPDFLDHPDAGQYYPPTSGSKVEAALVKAGDPLAIATKGSDEPVALSDLKKG
jgi:hypothetical protein